MIEFSNVTRYYGSLRALHDVSFSVREGEIIGLLGLNGAGKSTALKILAGLIAPSAGRVTIHGEDASEASGELTSKIGFLPEEPPLYRDMTVREFLIHAGQLKGMSRTDVLAAVPRIVEMAGLKGREHQVIATLSHGFRKRVGIGMAVIHDPKLVILDEPISGLDPRQIKDMRKVIRRLGEGRAVLISSHILTEISKTCDRVLVLHRGELVASGTQAEIMSRLAKLESASNPRVTLTLRGERDAVTSLLGEHEGVDAFEVQPAEPGQVTVELALTGDTREKVISDLVAAGIGIRTVHESEVDLEEAFLELTEMGGAA